MNTLLAINIVVLGCLLGILLFYKNIFNDFCKDIITAINDIIGAFTKLGSDIDNVGESAINAIKNI